MRANEKKTSRKPESKETSSPDQPMKSVSFKLDEAESEDSDQSNSHRVFMQKQAEAITAKDFIDSPKPGTPVQQGEIVGADGRPLPYRLKTPENVPQVDSKTAAEVSASNNGASTTSPAKSKTL